MNIKWRLGFAHELGMGLSATISVLIVLLGGAFPAPAWGVLLAPLISSALVVRHIEAPKFSGTALALAGIGLGVAQVVSRGTEVLVYGGGIALLGILAGRLITRRTLAHDIQTIILSLVLVMAGSVLNPGLSYGVLFVCFGITVIWALTTRQLLTGADASAVEQGHGAAAASIAIRDRTDIVTPSFFVATGGVAIAVLLATSVVFVAFPRVGLGSLSFFSSQQAGFPTSVNLNGGAINGGGTAVVARAFFVPKSAFLDGLYLRGMVYDGLSTSGASRLPVASVLTGTARRLADGKTGFTRYSVMMEPVAADIVLSLGPVDKSRTIKGGKVNPNRAVFSPSWNERGELSVGDKLRKPVRYALGGSISKPGYVPPQDRNSKARKRRRDERKSEANKDAWQPSAEQRSDGQRSAAGASDDVDDETVGKVQREAAAEMAPGLTLVPDDLDPELLALAKTFGDETTNIELVAARIRTFLMADFGYTLSQPNGSKAHPLVSFLLEDRRGHCEYFASAFVLLMRLQGIPARVVGGYQGGEYDGLDDVIIFRERNAHAWVEWLHPDFGWIVDDATPMASAEREYLTGLAAALDRLQRLWGDAVVDYSLGSQLQTAGKAASASMALLDKLSGSPLKVAGSAAAGAALLFLLLRFRRRRRDDVVLVDPLSLAMEACVGAVYGHRVPSAWTLREAVEGIDAAHPALALLRSALRAHERTAFGGGHLSDSAKEELLGALDTATKAATKRRKAES